jgi:hypothetical protein
MVSAIGFMRSFKGIVTVLVVALLVVLSNINTPGSRLIASKDIQNSLVSEAGSEQLFALTDSVQTTWVDVNTANDSLLRFKFPEATSLRKVVVVFDFNIPLPVDGKLSIRAFSGDKEIGETGAMISKVTSGELYFDLAQSADRVEMKIIANSKVRVLDIFFYESVPVSVLDKILGLLFNQPRSIGAYFGYSIIFLLSIILLGAQLIRRFRSLYQAELIPVTYVFGILGFTVLGMLVWRIEQIYDMPTKVWQLLFLLWLFLGFKHAFNRAVQPELFKNKQLLLAAGVLLVITICWAYVYEGSLSKHIHIQNDLYFDNSNRYQASIQPYQSDQVFPYNNAKVLLYGEGRVVGDYDKELASQLLHSRPQLFALLAQPFLQIFGDRYFVFTALSISLMPMLVFVTYLLSSSFLGGRVALLAAVLIPTNYYLLFLGGLTQIKYLTVILVAFYYYCIVRASTDVKKYSVLASITATLMLMTHYYTIIYLIAGAGYLLIRSGVSRKIVAISSLIPLLLLALWLVFIGSSTGLSLISTVSVGSDPSIVSQLSERLKSIVGLFVSNPYPEIWDRTIGYYKLTLPGMVSLSGFTVLAYWVWKNYKRYKSLILTLLAIPVLLSIFGIAEYTLFGIQLYFVGLLPLIYGALADAVLKMKHSLRLLVVTAIILEWLFILVIYYKEELLSPLIINGRAYPAEVVTIAVLCCVSVFVLTSVIKKLIRPDVTSA